MRHIRLYIDAVDVAEIDPPKNVPDPEQLFRHIHFQGGIQLEDLPFADGGFSGVVSQFGFEYAREKKAVTEAARVLAPGGRLRLVIHAKVGVVAEDIGVRLARLHSVLAENGPVCLVLALARAAEAGDVKTLNEKSKCLAAAVALTNLLDDHAPVSDSALFYSKEFLQLWARRRQFRPADLSRSLEDGWNNASSLALRQEQMLQAARSRNGIDKLVQRFTEAGLTVETVDQVYDANHATQIAWQVDARKPDYKTP
jgi:ubiquinone/menaquinone biosynthesis C-methylase UbiE